jgi:hypothetical protein
VKPRLLLDENLSPALRDALLRHDPTIDVLRVGDAGAPALSTPDPAILTYLEQHQRILITDNRASIPGHVADHLAAGGQHWGIFTIRPRAGLAEIIEALILLCEASSADEWHNAMRWIP